MKTQDDNNLKPIDALLARRGHGAVTVRAIRYQILYSAYCAFGLYEMDSGTSVRLEGIEDIDMLDLRLGDRYVQVKTSARPWHWSRLAEPVQNFLEGLRANSSCRLVLAVDFPLHGDVAALSRYAALGSKEKAHIRKKFEKLCHGAGASAAESDALLTKLSIVSLPEHDLLNWLRRRVADAYGLATELTDTYVLVIVAKFLEWAKERRVVTKSDLGDLRVWTAENLAREEQFEAYGRCLITRVSWQPDESPDDFFDGKATRPGHVAAGLDIRRETWLERIDKAADSSGVCIIRSSSGQGKSALLYRYAQEQWPAAHTYQLKAAKSPEDAELAREFLRFRSELGLPLFLLIDDAGWATQHWPTVAQQCAALGFPVLVSVRSEDWHRFARESLFNYEVVEPLLDLDEARAIFGLFKSKGRVHASVDSAEWAYEKIGEPRLLMEYVYLVTHGRMLEERLRDQVKQFSNLREDPGKVEILRKVALADALGAPLRAASLLKNVSDPQQVLNSLRDEYLSLEGDLLTGLHRVRSDHLVRILHEGHPNPAVTALESLDAVPRGSLCAFVANALYRDDLNADTFLAGLVEKAKKAQASVIIAFLDGLFEAGERRFFNDNKHLFEEAYQLLGAAGPTLLGSALLPTVRTDAVAELAQMQGEIGDNFRRLHEIAARATQTDRGLDLCRTFLVTIGPHLPAETLQEDPGTTGVLLDWCSLCGVQLLAWPNARQASLARPGLFDLALDSFCRFTQGFYRCDEPAYRDWFARNRGDMLGYLKLHLDCIELTVTATTLAVEFFPNGETGDTLNEQAVSRLKRLRSAIPFCERYQSQGIWPLGFTPSCDDTRREMPKENLPFESDVEKNVVWRRIVESRFLPDSYYRYQQEWHQLRDVALLFVRRLSAGLQHVLEGKRFSFQVAFEDGQLLLRLADCLRRTPDPPPQTPEPLKDALGRAPKRWSASLQSFLSQICQYVEDTTQADIGRLAVYNFGDAVKGLQEIHDLFGRLFEIAPDYFGAAGLNPSENRAYRALADLLDAWVINPAPVPQRDIRQYVRMRRERKRQEMLQRVRGAFAPLTDSGVTLIWPEDILVDYPLRYFPLAVSVDDSARPENAVRLTAEALAKVKDVADFFCLIPIHNGARFLKDGYQISSDQIARLQEGKPLDWASFVPCELPESLLSLLPPLPFQPSARLQLRTGVLGLLAEVAAIIEQKERIQPLAMSGNQFETELYRRHRARLRQSAIRLGTIARETRGALEAACASNQGRSAYGAILGFLETVEATEGSLEGLALSGNIDPQSVEDALERLLEST